MSASLACARSAAPRQLTISWSEPRIVASPSTIGSRFFSSRFGAGCGCLGVATVLSVAMVSLFSWRRYSSESLVFGSSVCLGPPVHSRVTTANGSRPRTAVRSLHSLRSRNASTLRSVKRRNGPSALTLSSALMNSIYRFTSVRGVRYAAGCNIKRRVITDHNRTYGRPVSDENLVLARYFAVELSRIADLGVHGLPRAVLSSERDWLCGREASSIR